MIKLPYRQVVFILLLAVTYVSCQDKEEPSLRSSERDIFYASNNQSASKRLAAISYNTKDSVNKIERFKLVHISDAHVSSWSSDNEDRYPNNLIEAVKFANQPELKINAMVASGDHVGTNPKTSKQEAVSSFLSCMHFLYNQNYIPTFTCTGNHDTNMLIKKESEYISKEEIHQFLFQNKNYSIQQLSGQNYYYADLDNPMGGKIRIIALDMTDQDSYTYDTQHDAIFSQQQIDWLCNTALKENMSKDHSVIVLTHYPFQAFYAAAYTFLCDGDFVHTWKMVPEIIEAFRSKKKLNRTYPNKEQKESISVNVDFTSSPGEFVCYLGGHAHLTAHYSISSGLYNQSKLTPQKMLLCTNMSPSEIGTKYNKVIRESNSISSNSFCIYAIDTKEKKIYITFFGAYKPTNKPDYESTQEISYL